MNPDTCVPIWKVENGILEKVERGGRRLIIAIFLLGF